MREDKQIENREVQSFLVPPVTTPVGGDYGVENKAQVSPADQQGPRPHLKASRILYMKKAIYPQCGATIKAALKKKKKKYNYFILHYFHLFYMFILTPYNCKTYVMRSMQGE